MKRRLQSFSMGSSSYILAKRLLPSTAETFRTHVWSLLPRCAVPFSSMANPLEVGRPLKPISISNKNRLLPFLKDQDISSKGLLSAKAETFRTHDWPLLLKYTVPFSSMGNTPQFVDHEEMDGGSLLKPISISDKDLQLPSFLNERHFSSLLSMLLPPAMAEKMKTVDSSLQLKFSSNDSKLNIEDALKSELAAICVWFLFTEVPPHVQLGVARTLTFISLGTSKVTKISVNQMDIENLVVRILRSGNTEAQRQVCLALSVLGGCPSRRWAVNSGDGIQDQLLDLVCNSSNNPDFACHVLSAFASVSLDGKGMREKIIETELLHSWLVKLLSRKDESIMVDACRMLACIAGERCDSELWVHVKEKLLPPIINGLCCQRSNLHLLQVVAYALSKITKYASPDQINDVVEIGGLKFLVFACSRTEEDKYLLEKCFDAIDNILRVGEAKAMAKAKAKGKGYYEEMFEEYEADIAVKNENEYANRIDGYGYIEYDGVFDGWEMLLLARSEKHYDHPIVRKAESLVHKYRPQLEREPIY